MNIGASLDRLRTLSDDELLAGLNGVLGANRRLVALVLAHLAEVEERRLHLLAGYGSLFAYCTARLAMSEDEAYRRIRVARLARRFPGILALLATGEVTLSVVALLDSLLTEANHTALLAAVSGKTVARAREVLASWFPRPDVLPFIRKLPARPASVATSALAGSSACSPPSNVTERERDVEPPVMPPLLAPSVLEPLEATASESHRPPPPTLPRPSRPSSCVEPLAPGRYKVQLTVDAEIKRKLDLARDLLRHAVPSGDLATLLGRALDLLIEKTLQRRFAKTQRATAAATTDAPSPSNHADVTSELAAAEPPPSRSHHLPSAVRRTVLERDGVRCTWRAPDGTRCESRAWLEHDHIDPRGQGGSDNPENIRIRCRAHNRLGAERTYGKATIDRIITRQPHAPKRCDEPSMMIDNEHVEARTSPGLR